MPVFLSNLALLGWLGIIAHNKGRACLLGDTFGHMALTCHLVRKTKHKMNAIHDHLD